MNGDSLFLNQSSSAWYLVYSKARKESFARDNLERQGYTVFFPQIHETRRRSRSLVKVIGPLFPRYLFVSLSKAFDNWSPIRSTFGVSKIVKFGDIPVPVPPKLIEAIKTRAGEQCIVEAPERQFVRNEKLRILHGSLAGYEAIFHTKNSHERVTLLFDLLGRTIPVEVPLSYIE